MALFFGGLILNLKQVFGKITETNPIYIVIIIINIDVYIYIYANADLAYDQERSRAKIVLNQLVYHHVLYVTQFSINRIFTMPRVMAGVTWHCGDDMLFDSL